MKGGDALRVAATVLLLGLFYMDPDPNQVTRRYLAQSYALLDERTFTVPIAYRSGDARELPGTGRALPVSLPGTAVLLVPCAAVGRRLVAFLGLGLEPWVAAAILSIALVLVPCAAALAGLVVELRRRSTGDTLAAAVVALGLVLGTPTLFYAARVYDYAPAALLLLLAWASVEQCAARGRGPAFVGGLAAGLATFFNYGALWPTLALLAWAPAAVDRRAAARLWVGAALGALPLAVFHSVYLGAPWRTLYALQLEPEVRVFHPAWWAAYTWIDLREALEGLTFGMKGIFWYVPLFWAVFPAAVLGVRRSGLDGWRARVGLTAFLLVFLFNLGLRHGLWVGGSGFGPRHMTLAWPFLFLGAAPVFETWARRPKAGAVLATLFAWSVGANALGWMFGHADSLSRHAAYFVLSGPTSPLYRYLAHLGPDFFAARLAATGANPNPYAHYHALTHLSPAGGYLLLAAALALLWRRAPPPPAEKPT